MNKLQNTFKEYFEPFYYYDNSGRAYIEYSCWEQESYLWKVSFFHFSIQDKHKNALYNLRILKFIQKNYSLALSDVWNIFRYCIKNNCIIGIVSTWIKHFSIRISQWDSICRELILLLYKQKTWNNFIFPHWNFTCPVELHFELNTCCTLVGVSVYEKVDVPEWEVFQKWYLEELNIFLAISCRYYSCYDLTVEEKIWYKLYEPITLWSSKFLMDEYYPTLESLSANFNNIFVNTIERNIVGDSISFTQWYCIEA